jgi:hypothetical protein
MPRTGKYAIAIFRSVDVSVEKHRTMTLIVAASLRRKRGESAAVGGGAECLAVQSLLYHSNCAGV